MLGTGPNNVNTGFLPGFWAVRFARHWDKMYSRHLFPHGGLFSAKRRVELDSMLFEEITQIRKLIVIVRYLFCQNKMLVTIIMASVEKE